MSSKSPYTFKSIKGLRDVALMLSLAKTYLSEEPLLKRIGRTIDRHLRELRGDISFLKKTYPGKFLNEVDTDQVVEGIQDTAERMQEADKEIREKCAQGEVGEEMESSVKVLVDAVDEISSQVEGEVKGYTIIDSIASLYNRLSYMVSQVTTLTALAIKASLLLILACAVPFSYLLVTMESEEDLLKRISQSKIHIRSQKELISKLEVEKRELAEKIEPMTHGELSRQEKVRVMDLDMKLYKMKEDALKAQIEIAISERQIKETQKRLEELKKKSFLQRVLRQ